MTQYVAILRGINVGGKRKILMADLKSLFAELGFDNISTYIQSGNVLFAAPAQNEPSDLSQKIAQAIHDQFGFDVPVIIRTPKELKEALDSNPFYQTDTDTPHLHLTFLSEVPTKDAQTQLKTYDFAPDKFVMKDKEVFIYCEGKYHKSKLTNNFFEKKLKVRATTRNWKTVLKLQELSG